MNCHYLTISGLYSILLSHCYFLREKLMACPNLLFIVILTTVSKVTSLHCSDQQLPSSGDDNLQQVTTLQYCLVDNCNIKRIDTGEKLNIVYTTDSLIVTAPTDGRTSVVIAKQEIELPCLEPTNLFYDHRSQLIPTIIIFLIVHGLSWYIIAVHLMFKELRTLFGKLLMLYNIAAVFLFFAFVGTLMKLVEVAFNSLPLCYIIVNGGPLSVVPLEALGTCLLHHIVVVLRRCYNLRPAMSEQTSQRHLRYYMAYTMATFFLVLLLIISYDVATGNYNNTILPDGRCWTNELSLYSTLFVSILSVCINKVVQIVMFCCFLNLVYKMSVNYGEYTVLPKEYLSLLRKTATALGAVIGLSHFTYIIVKMLGLDLATISPLLAGLFLVQQSIVAAIFASTKMVRRLCREHFFKN